DSIYPGRNISHIHYGHDRAYHDRFDHKRFSYYCLDPGATVGGLIHTTEDRGKTVRPHKSGKGVWALARVVPSREGKKERDKR
ncbi:MAG: hypothetical protein ACWGPR_02115, partial [Candidatus Deferrimicrobiaceae bacterium]